MSRPSEDDLIARYFAPLAGSGGLGLRDDAALATPRPGYDLVVTKDMAVAGVHVFSDDPPDAIARKALRVNLSDLAAKAARPIGFLLGLALPTDWNEPWLRAFVDGLGDDARAFACPLLGGDTVSTPGPLTISVTAFGDVPAGRMVSRGGARPGDALYVTGTIGDAALGLQVRRQAREDGAWLAALPSADAAALLARHRRPEPRLGCRDALAAHARCAMDVSDGLIGDLTKMLRLEGLTTTLSAGTIPLSSAARAAIRLDPKLFPLAVTGGDDYEIICAVPPESAADFEAATTAAGVEATRIGSAAIGTEPVALLDLNGTALAVGRTSFQHFV